MTNNISITTDCYKDDLAMYARFITATLEYLRMPSLPKEERDEGILVLNAYVSKFNSMAEFVIELS